MPHKLSILVPVYNEVATVRPLLRRVARIDFPIEREIIVVDDGSTDGSREVLRELANEGLIRYVEHETNRGKGVAVRTALERADGDILVVQDADLELDPDDLPSLLEPILTGQTQVCYGTRFAPPVPARLRRLPTFWANRVLNWISNVLNGIDITDFNTCYKMMTARVMSRLSITQNGFAMEPEITAKIACMGYQIVERPIRYEPRTVAGGKKIRPVDFFKYLLAMVRYRFFWARKDEAVAEEAVLRPA